MAAFFKTDEHFTAGALTLPQRFYVSDDVFRREQERIFRRYWICAGHQSRATKRVEVVPSSSMQAGLAAMVAFSPDRPAGENAAVAKEFLENWVLELGGLETINADVALGTPANKEFYKKLASDPNIKATMANAQLGAPMPNIPEMGKFWSSMQPALENVTTGRQKPKEALDGAAQRITGK